MQSIVDALNKLNVPEADKQDILNGFHKLANNVTHYPSELWECAATGAFKECYLWSNVAIKFASEDNNTMDSEAQPYDAFVNKGVADIFAKSFFIPIPYGWDLRSQYLDDDSPEYIYDTDYYAWVATGTDNFNSFDCIVVQEKVKTVYQSMYHIDDDLFIVDYDDHPLFDEFGNIISHEQASEINEIFCFKQWTQDAIIAYGIEFIMKTVSICKDLGIFDLHRNNIGYREDHTPVIFDFLS